MEKLVILWGECGWFVNLVCLIFFWCCGFNKGENFIVVSVNGVECCELDWISCLILRMKKGSKDFGV